jgi:hypothetical protein
MICLLVNYETRMDSERAVTIRLERSTRMETYNITTKKIIPQMNLKEVAQLVLKYEDRNWWLSYGMVSTQGFSKS